MTQHIEIIKPGFVSLLVDAGRQHKQHLGFSGGGPLDYVAYHWAAALAGALPQNSPVVFETVGNLVCRLAKESWIAATGKDVELRVDGALQPVWARVLVSQGQEISLSTRRVGQRSYLAVQGQLQVGSSIGSVSTVMREGLGGLFDNGQPLRAGDKIAINHTYDSPSPSVSRVTPFFYDLAPPISIVLGYQAEKMPPTAIETMLNSTYRVQSDSDRMGLRLTGEKIDSLSGAFYSEGLHLGSIQITPNGQPIIMLADRQTLGGYAKIGAVARVDLPRVAQAIAGDCLTFKQIDSHSARNAYRLQQLRWKHGTI